MQDEKLPRSNRERTDATRRELMAVARRLFVSKGYAATSTPEIAQASGMTRGALYHHFADKRDLLRAVLVAEAEAVGGSIGAVDLRALSARDALIAGSEAYLDAMTVPGRTRLLLVEGPAALGADESKAIDEAHAAHTLRNGLKAAMPPSEGSGISVDILASLLSAAFDRAALMIQDGADPEAVKRTMTVLVVRLLDP